MKLMIVESPIKARKIKEMLAAEWEVLPTYGHIEELPEKRIGIEINEEERKINVEYEVIKPNVLSKILDVSHKAQEIYLATDPDREGEAIAYQVYKKIIHLGKLVFRITFNSITKSSILKAIENKREIDLNLVESQVARRVIDRLIGYVLSPLAIEKYGKPIAVGRVQSPAVNFIRKREAEVLNHIKEPFWFIEAVCYPIYFAGLNNAFRAVSEQSFSKYQDAKSVAEKISAKFRVSRIKKGRVNVSPSKPLITAKLLSESFRRFGYSASKTMKIAQRLYERGYCTYVRTDSYNISDEGHELAKNFIENQYGKQYYDKRNFESDVFSQESHECIRPTVTKLENKKSLTEEEKRIFSLISEYFYTSQMADAQYEQTDVVLTNEDEVFKAVGRKLMFDGFLRHYKGESKVREVKLPYLEENQILYGNAYLQKAYMPFPKLYSEADLIEELYKKKIGRPSTYAVTIENIKKKGYVKGSNSLRTTELADYLIKFLNNPKYNFLLDEDYSKQLEESLDKVASGKLQKEDVIFDVYEKLKPAMKQPVALRVMRAR